MVINIKSSILMAVIAVLISACGLDPNGLNSAKNDNPEKKMENFIEESTIEEDTSIDNDLHTVIVNEVLYATKYVYIKVSEGVNKFWIATLKKEIKIGETYYYNGGLLKTNFESKEFNKVFDEIYLVSNLVGSDHASHTSSNNNNSSEIETKNTTVTSFEGKNQPEGSIQIAELVKNSKKYEGKTVQISGKCVKINPNIMNRNWIHLQDGSKNDFDLVITSDIFVPEGTEVTFRAVVGLKRDFGAGYTYDLILENGVIVQ